MSQFEVDPVTGGSVDLDAGVVAHFEHPVTAVLPHASSVITSVISEAVEAAQLWLMVARTILEVVKGYFDGLGGVNGDVPGAAAGTYDSASACHEWVGCNRANEPAASCDFHRMALGTLLPSSP